MCDKILHASFYPQRWKTIIQNPQLQKTAIQITKQLSQSYYLTLVVQNM